MKPIKNDNYYEQRITRLEVLNETICSTLVRLEKKIDDNFIDTKSELRCLRDDFSGLNKKVDYNLSELNKKIDSNFKWLISSVLITFGGTALSSLLTITVKILHWIN